MNYEMTLKNPLPDNYLTIDYTDKTEEEIE